MANVVGGWSVNEALHPGDVVQLHPLVDPEQRRAVLCPSRARPDLPDWSLSVHDVTPIYRVRLEDGSQTWWRRRWFSPVAQLLPGQQIPLLPERR